MTTTIFLGLVALFAAGAGHTILCARVVGEALALAERDHPDLFVADVMMPPLSGIELAETLEGKENGHGPPVLLMSPAPPSPLPARTGLQPIRKVCMRVWLG